MASPMSLLMAKRRIDAAGLELVYSDLVPRDTQAIYFPPDDERPGVIAVNPHLDGAAKRVAVHVALEHHRLGHTWTDDPACWADQQSRARAVALERLLPAEQLEAVAARGLTMEEAAAALDVDAQGLRQRLGRLDNGEQHLLADERPDGTTAELPYSVRAAEAPTVVLPPQRRGSHAPGWAVALVLLAALIGVTAGATLVRPPAPRAGVPSTPNPSVPEPASGNPGAAEQPSDGTGPQRSGPSTSAPGQVALETTTVPKRRRRTSGADVQLQVAPSTTVPPAPPPTTEPASESTTATTGLPLPTLPVPSVGLGLVALGG